MLFVPGNQPDHHSGNNHEASQNPQTKINKLDSYPSIVSKVKPDNHRSSSIQIGHTFHWTFLVHYFASGNLINHIPQTGKFAFKSGFSLKKYMHVFLSKIEDGGSIHHKLRPFLLGQITEFINGKIRVQGIPSGFKFWWIKSKIIVSFLLITTIDIRNNGRRHDRQPDYYVYSRECKHKLIR